MFSRWLDGNQSTKEKKVPAKITIPPTVGIIRLCNLRSSFGVSNNRLSIATLISEGVANNTTTNEVINDKKMSFTADGLFTNVIIGN